MHFMKNDEGGGWLFPEFFKVTFSSDGDVGLGMRLYSAMVGAGLIIVEPVVKVCDKLGLTD